MAGSGIFSRLLCGAVPARAQSPPKKELVPKGTDLQTLINRNPKFLDTRRLETMPTEDFKTMGLSDHQVDLTSWRLRVTGKVRSPLALTYGELIRLPAVERNVLLLCPGVFCNHGRWQGVSIRALAEAAGADPAFTHVTIRGPSGNAEKSHRLSKLAFADDQAFLAFGVNGKNLPVKHGFPLRLVSENDYGFDWIKYVDHMEVQQIEALAGSSGSGSTTF
jgi:sulfoxide reductase catalytic subunit YedY